MSARSDRHHHAAQRKVTVNICDHIPWDTVRDRTTVIPVCSCGGAKPFCSVYTVCNCGLIIGQLVGMVSSLDFV